MHDLRTVSTKTWLPCHLRKSHGIMTYRDRAVIFTEAAYSQGKGEQPPRGRGSSSSPLTRRLLGRPLKLIIANV